MVVQHLTQVKASESELVERRESLQSAARELLAAGGPFDTELLRLKDALGAELLAGAFEDASVEDAAVLEARLGPLVQALVVDDPATAAKQVHGRPDSLSDVWLVSRDEDAARLGAGAARESEEADRCRRLGAAGHPRHADPDSSSPRSEGAREACRGAAC